jgi:anthranilate phosphoribosyltransferase
MNTLLNKLVLRKDLTSKETVQLFDAMANGTISEVETAAILTALHMKGETVEEIYGFASAMRNHMRNVYAPDAIDVCGTGGDGSGTFNISTTTAFVVAGAGVKVAKHGNRAASSKCGSADVLEKLGIKIDLTPEQAENVFGKVGMVFLFAPYFHPAMRHVGAVRKALKIRTIFNVLGPFANPASVKRQIIGVPDVLTAKKLAEVAELLNYEHLLLVTSDDGLDEISLSDKTTIFDISHGVTKQTIITPEDYGFKKVNKRELFGGTAEDNALIHNKVLSGEKGPTRDIVILNAAAALYVAGKAEHIAGGIPLATQSIDSGYAKATLENLRKEIQAYA